MQTHTKLLTILILCFCPFNSGAFHVHASPKSLHHPLEPVILSNKSYCEAWELSAVLEDETFIQTQMIITNIGLKDGNAVCQILLLHPGEKPWKTSKRFARADWTFSETPNPVLSIGHCCIAQVKDSTICTMAFDNARVDFFFNAVPKPIKTPSVNVGEEKSLKVEKASSPFYTYELLLRSKVRASIWLAGRQKKMVSGFGILVHSRSIGYPKDFSKKWVYYYGYREGCWFLANFRFPPHDTFGVVGWIWKDNEQPPQSVSGMKVSEADKIEGKNRTLVDISAPDESFTFISHDELCRFSIKDETGVILGTILKFVVGNPVTRFYKAQATFSPPQPPVPGILEIMKFE